MAKKKFTQLPAANLPLAGTEIFALVQGGVSKQASVSSLTTASGLIVRWNFSDNDGDYPTDPTKLYVVIDNSVLPENTWMVAITETPTDAGDFLTK